MNRWSAFFLRTAMILTQLSLGQISVLAADLTDWEVHSALRVLAQIQKEFSHLDPPPVYIGIGRSPTLVIAALQNEGKALAVNVPLSEFRYERTLTLAEEAALMEHFEFFLPPIESLQGRAIVVVDFASSGTSLRAGYVMLRKYLRMQGYTGEIHALGLSLPEEAPFVWQAFKRAGVEGALKTVLLDERNPFTTALMDKLYDESAQYGAAPPKDILANHLSIRMKREEYEKFKGGLAKKQRALGDEEFVRRLVAPYRTDLAPVTVTSGSITRKPHLADQWLKNVTLYVDVSQPGIPLNSLVEAMRALGISDLTIANPGFLAIGPGHPLHAWTLESGGTTDSVFDDKVSISVEDYARLEEMAAGVKKDRSPPQTVTPVARITAEAKQCVRVEVNKLTH